MLLLAANHVHIQHNIGSSSFTIEKTFSISSHFGFVVEAAVIFNIKLYGTIKKINQTTQAIIT